MDENAGSSPAAPTKINLCLNCQKSTKNKKFCSRKCSASFTNKIPKRKRTKLCKTCKLTYILSDRDECKECFSKSKLNITTNTTISEFINRPSVKDKHTSWKFAHIRNYAKKLNKHRVKICQKCGYSQHVELAHIKPVSSFPLTSTIFELNCPTNILILCRNCHWEFDNNKFTINDIIQY